MPKLGKNQFYCLKCRHPVSVDPRDICVKMVSNKKVGKVPMMKSYCDSCRAKLCKITSKDNAREHKRCYNY